MQNFFLSRSEFFDHAEEHLSNAYFQTLENKKLEKENNLLKTYVIENNVGDFSLEYLQKYLKPFFFQMKNKRKNYGKIHQTDEENFYILEHDNVHLYLDCTSQDRFCQIYTMGDAVQSDRVVKNLLSSTYFDNLWLWNDFLKNIQDTKGQPRGFGLDYDYRRFDNSDEKTNYIKMQIFGGSDTRDIYDLLANSESIQDKIILSRVGVKIEDNSNRDDFMIETIKYNGKVTSKGTSIYQHQKLVKDLKNEYSEKLQKIEDNFRIGIDFDPKSKNYRIEGKPLYFKFSEQLSNEMMDLFVEKVFNGAMPFRLLGFPSQLGNFGRFIEVVDLHIGESFSLEIYPDLMVVYLSENICGNTIFRLYTNLQHFFSKKIEVCSDDEKQLF